MEYEIENHIRGYRDNDLNGVLKNMFVESHLPALAIVTLTTLGYQEDLMCLMQNLILLLMLIHQENHIILSMVKLHIV